MARKRKRERKRGSNELGTLTEKACKSKEEAAPSHLLKMLTQRLGAIQLEGHDQIFLLLKVEHRGGVRNDEMGRSAAYGARADGGLRQ